MRRGRIAPGEWSERATVVLHGQFPPETIAAVHEAVQNKQPFGLTDGEGGALFTPHNLTSYEFGENKKIKSINSYQDFPAFQDAVKMYLAFYVQFMPVQKIISYNFQFQLSPK